MQTAEIYFQNTNAQEKENRTLPILATIAVHVLIVYGLALSTGILPKPEIFVPAQYVDVPLAKENQEEPTKLVQQTTEQELTKLPVVIKPDIDVASPEAPDDPIVVARIDEIGPTAQPTMQMQNARVLRSPEPDYPAVSRIRDEQGVVMVRIDLSAAGTVSDAQVERSSGFSRLDEAALKAVRTWKFAPAKRGAEAVATSVIVPVRFELHNR